MHNKNKNPRTPATLDDILQAARQRAKKLERENPGAHEHGRANEESPYAFARDIDEKKLDEVFSQTNKEAARRNRSGNDANRVLESETIEMASTPGAPEDENTKQPEQQAEQDVDARSNMTAEEFARELRRAEIRREKAELEAEERRLLDRIKQCDEEIADAVKQMSQKNPYWDYVPGDW